MSEMKASLHRLLAGVAASVAALFVFAAVVAPSALATIAPSIHARGFVIPRPSGGALTTGEWVGIALAAAAVLVVIAVSTISSLGGSRRDVAGTVASVEELPRESSATESESKDKKAA
jgi:hypothetical protein